MVSGRQPCRQLHSLRCSVPSPSRSGRRCLKLISPNSSRFNIPKRTQLCTRQPFCPYQPSRGRPPFPPTARDRAAATRPEGLAAATASSPTALPAAQGRAHVTSGVHPPPAADIARAAPASRETRRLTRPLRPSPFGNFRHRQTLPIGPRSASMGADPTRATRSATARGAGPGLVRRRRRRRRGGREEARGQSAAPACRARLFRPGHGASPPPRHGSPCPCSSPLSERKWPPPPSQRPQPPPPPQQQRGRHLGEAGAGSAPRQETGSGGPDNARREAGRSERGGEPRGHPQRPHHTAAGPAPQVSTAAAAQGRAGPVAGCAPLGRGSPLPSGGGGRAFS